MEYVVQDEILSVILLGREAENRVQLVLETALSPANWDEAFLLAPGGAKAPGVVQQLWSCSLRGLESPLVTTNTWRAQDLIPDLEVKHSTITDSVSN